MLFEFTDCRFLEIRIIRFMLVCHLEEDRGNNGRKYDTKQDRGHEGFRQDPKIHSFIGNDQCDFSARDHSAADTQRLRRGIPAKQGAAAAANDLCQHRADAQDRDKSDKRPGYLDRSQFQANARKEDRRDEHVG